MQAFAVKSWRQPLQRVIRQLHVIAPEALAINLESVVEARENIGFEGHLVVAAIEALRERILLGLASMHIAKLNAATEAPSDHPVVARRSR